MRRIYSSRPKNNDFCVGKILQCRQAWEIPFTGRDPLPDSKPWPSLVVQLKLIRAMLNSDVMAYGVLTLNYHIL